MLVAVYILTWQTSRRDDWACLAMAAALTLPPVSMAQTLMTIDAPYTCCWAWALVFGHATFVGGRRYLWFPLGLTIGLGILAKFTMVLWLVSLVLFLISRPSQRHLMKSASFWGTVGVASFMALPILWWNYQNGWLSFRHVGVQAGVENSSGGIWYGPIVFILGQFGLLLGFWFLVWLAVAWSSRPKRDSDPSRDFLWFLSVPQFLLFAAVSWRTKVQLNWPITAYISGLILTLPVMARWLQTAGSAQRRLLVVGMSWAIGTGTVATVFVRTAPAVRPWLAYLVDANANPESLRIRWVDPSARLSGWSYLADQVDAIRWSLRQEGIEPIVAASRWTTASELAFYCEGQPAVYSLGSALWDRHSQFDVWRPNPIADPNEFFGKTMIFVDVGPLPREMANAFEEVEPTRQIAYLDRGVAVAIWDVTVCRGFRGFSRLPPPHY